MTPLIWDLLFYVGMPLLSISIWFVAAKLANRLPDEKGHIYIKELLIIFLIGCIPYITAIVAAIGLIVAVFSAWQVIDRSSFWSSKV